MDDNITKFLSLYDIKVLNVASDLRNFLIKNLPNIQEQLDPESKIIAFGYDPGYKDNICNILLSKTGIKLGFNRGAELPDPSKLLTGNGKVHKYIEINSERDINTQALKKMLKEANKAYKKRMIGM